MKVACGYTIPITLFGIPPSPVDRLKGMDLTTTGAGQAHKITTFHQTPVRRPQG